MPPPRPLRRLSMRLARHWLLTLLVSELVIFTAGYFYFTTMHALESLDTASCVPLTADSSTKCVSTLQVLLNDDRPRSAISVDGYFGKQTRTAITDFQSAHHLKEDGIVGGKTANAINEFSPRPNIVSYATGFVNSTLAVSAKMILAALMMAVAIICLLLRAMQTGSGRLLGIRCCLAGLFTALIAANSTAMESLMADAHGGAAKLLWFVLVGLTAALFRLLGETFPT